MSYILVLAFFVGFASAQKSDGTHPFCVSKAGGQAKNIKNWSFNNSKSVKCYFQCLFIRENIINKQGGKFNDDNYFNLFNTEALKGTADNCLTKQLIDTAHECEGAYQIFKCNYDADSAAVKKSLIVYFDNKLKNKKKSKNR
uniref:Salivary D7 secreted protein n=1 Tax=Simulium guianense TaxID=445764 RepID=F5GTV3_SIMGU